MLRKNFISLSACLVVIILGGGEGRLYDVSINVRDVIRNAGDALNVSCEFNPLDGSDDVNPIFRFDAEDGDGFKLLTRKDGFEQLVIERDDGSVKATLLIGELAATHQGVYQCTLLNISSGVLAEATATVRLSVPPSVAIATEVFANENETAHIRCNATGLPLPDIKLMKVEKSLHSPTLSSGKGSVSYDHVGVKLEDLGIIYECEATNIAGSQRGITQLIVRHPPIITFISPNQSVMAEQETRLSCRAVGFPTPQITWQLKANNVTKSKRIDILTQTFNGKINEDGRTSTIVINQTETRDRGVYTCLAESYRGSDRQTVYNEVIAKPDAPQKPKILDFFQYIVKLSWPHPSSNNAPLQLYDIHFFERNSTSWQFQKVSIENLQNVQVVFISGLLPWREYKFKVRAKNAIGWGNFSDETDYQRTLPVAPKAPDAPEAIQTTPTTITLVWTFSRWTLSQGNIKKYHVRYRQSNHSEFKPRLSTLQPQAIISGLKKGQSYFFSIKAGNGYNDGPFSEESDIMTNITVPGFFKKMSTTVLSHEKVRVSWADLSDNGGSPLTKIRVSWKSVSNSSSSHWNESRKQPEPTDSQVVVDGLQEQTEYVFRLSIFNKAGLGTPSAITNAVRTLEFQYPPDVTRIMVNNVLPDSVNGTLFLSTAVLVVPVESIQLDLTILQCRNSSNETERRNVSATTVLLDAPARGRNQLTWSLGDLQPGVEYFLSAAAKNEYASSQSLRNISFSTPDGLPLSPTNIRVDFVSHNSVQLSWLLSKESRWPPSEVEIQFYNLNGELIKATKEQYKSFVLISDLQHSVQYKAYVFLWSHYGRSKAYAELEFQTNARPSATTMAKMTTPSPTINSNVSSISNDQTKLVVIIAASVGLPIVVIIAVLLVVKACKKHKARAKADALRRGKADNSTPSFYERDTRQAVNWPTTGERPVSNPLGGPAGPWGGPTLHLSRGPSPANSQFLRTENRLADDLHLEGSNTDISVTFTGINREPGPSQTAVTRSG